VYGAPIIARLKSNLRSTIICQLIYGVWCLHHIGVTIGDIKTANTLFRKDRRATPVVGFDTQERGCTPYGVTIVLADLDASVHYTECAKVGKGMHAHCSQEVCLRPGEASYTDDYLPPFKKRIIELSASNYKEYRKYKDNEKELLTEQKEQLKKSLKRFSKTEGRRNTSWKRGEEKKLIMWTLDQLLLNYNTISIGEVYKRWAKFCEQTIGKTAIAESKPTPFSKRGRIKAHPSSVTVNQEDDLYALGLVILSLYNQSPPHVIFTRME